MKKTLFLFLLFFTLVHSTQAQTPTLQQKLYYTCKVWGFVKYYHSNVSMCNVNWDSVLVSVLPAIESATSYNQFNNALDTMLDAAGPMALSTTYFPDTLTGLEKENLNFGWIDSSATFIRADVQTILDTIKNNFRPHAECWVQNNTWTGSYVGWLVYPYDSLMLNLNTRFSYPIENQRLLAFFKYWNIINYFNPYNYVINKPWDTTLSAYVIPIDTVSNAQSFYYLHLNVVHTLSDLHAWGGTFSTNYQQPPGNYEPYLLLSYTNGQYVVDTSVITGINTGDAIISIDGLTTAQWEDSIKPYFSYGDSAAFHLEMCINILGRPAIGDSETLVVEDSTGTNHTFRVRISDSTEDGFYTFGYYYPCDSIEKIQWTMFPCNIGYVDLGYFDPTNLSAMYADLINADAIIFDLRAYPNVQTVQSIANLLFPDYEPDVKWLLPDVTYPGTFTWQIDGDGIRSNPTPYRGKIIILTNEYTFSGGEYAVMILQAFPGGVITVGSQTDGVDGNVSYFRITDDLATQYTGTGVFYPNGDSTQRIGIVTDTVIFPTRASFLHHDDEVVDKALEIACALTTKNIDAPKTVVTVYPNPAINELQVQIANANAAPITTSITDITGKILMTQTTTNTGSSTQATFDISALSPGLYFVISVIDGGQVVNKVMKE